MLPGLREGGGNPVCHGDSQTGAKGVFVQDDPKEIVSPGMECVLFVCASSMRSLFFW